MAKKITKVATDEAHEVTDEILELLEARIREEYTAAEQEIEDELIEYFEKFATKDEIQLEALSKGIITQDEYNQWKFQQLAVGQKWENLKNTISYELTKTNQIAKEIAYNTMPYIYALNFNYGTYQVETASGIVTGFHIYSKNTVAVLFDDSDKLYHEAGIKLSKKIAVNKDLAWNKQQIQSIMTQSILKGESIPKIATRLQNGASQPFDVSDVKNAASKTAEQIATEVASKNRNAAIRNARTMTTYVENRGRYNSYKQAESKGLKGKKIWRAVHDNRTRHEHRLLDYQKVGLDDYFEVDGYEIFEPSDPEAAPHLIYNCRCRLAYEFEGYERKKYTAEVYENQEIEGMSWKEWQNAKATSQKITHQEEVGESIKQSYIAEYRRKKK